MSEDELLTPDEVKDLLRVAGGTVRSLLRSGEFPNAFRVGKRQWRIPRSDVDRYIEQKRAARQCYD